MLECLTVVGSWGAFPSYNHHNGKEKEMNTISQMSFEEWKQHKQNEQKRKTHNAEEIRDSRLYDLAFAVDKVCFSGELVHDLLKLYYIPDDLKKPGVHGLYGYHVIMIDKDYHKQHGTDDDMKDTIFHELVHDFCDSRNPEKKIKDADSSGYHLQAFADVCSDHGGSALYADAETGYSDARLSAESLDKINKQYQRYQKMRE